MERYILYETYRLAILIDLVKPAELIAEIDDYISDTPTEEIPHVFYVLSLASNRRRMLELLTDLAEGIDEDLPSCIVAGLLHRERDRFTTAQLYHKAELLVSLLKDQEADVAIELRGVIEANTAAHQAYGMRFKRKKARERMLAKNEKALKNVLAKYEKYAEVFDDKEWGR